MIAEVSVDFSIDPVNSTDEEVNRTEQLGSKREDVFDHLFD